jgi:hypothetical protein
VAARPLTGDLRTIVAFLVTPLAVPIALLPYLLFGQRAPGWPTSVLILMTIISYIGLLVFGVPTFVLLIERGWTAFWLAPLCGFAFGVVTWLACLVVVALVFSYSLADVFTWDSLAEALWPGGGAGVVSGAIFWLIARPDRHADEPGA